MAIDGAWLDCKYRQLQPKNIHEWGHPTESCQKYIGSSRNFTGNCKNTPEVSENSPEVDIPVREAF